MESCGSKQKILEGVVVKDLASTYVLRPWTMLCPYFRTRGKTRETRESLLEQSRLRPDRGGVETNLIFRLRSTNNCT